MDYVHLLTELGNTFSEFRLMTYSASIGNTHHSITCTLFEIELANFMEEKNEDC